jgi:alkylation response protein AidB-like acyl-CoA dehydrogenase
VNLAFTADEQAGRGAHDVPGAGQWQRPWRGSGAASIAGGTSEVPKNVVGERILGMPRG